VTCRSDHDPQLSREDDLRVQRVLAAHDVPSEIVVWSDPAIEWEALAAHAQAVIVRSAWDYFLDREQFLGIMGTISARTVLLNPLEVIRWNIHKSYLEDLRFTGIPTIPTVWLRGHAATIAHLCEQYGWTRAVLKPAISTNAHNTLLFESADCGLAQQHLATYGSCNEMLLQPYFERVATVGERSLVFIDGVFSHAFRKQAALEEDQEGEHPVRATPAEIALGQRVLRATATILRLPNALLYARVDLVQDACGHWTLMELELVEPRLRLKDSATAVERLCAAILGRIAERSEEVPA